MAHPVIYYMATTPLIYVATCQALGKAGLNTPNARLVLEKPIGTDLKSARAINDGVGAIFPENSIFSHRPLSWQRDCTKPDGAPGLATHFLNLYGHTTMSIIFRLQSQKTSALRVVPIIMTAQVPCVTWSKIIFYNCYV